MRPAVAMLARGWYHGARRWWLGTTAILAVVCALVLVVVGIFEGMEEASEERIHAFFTGDLRVTPERPQAAPAVFFANGTDPVGTLTEASRGGGDGRIETTFVLSRRTLLEAYESEDEQFRIGVPGVDVAGREFYGVGVLIGIDTHDAGAMGELRPFRVTGSFPTPSAAEEGAVPVMVSTRLFAAALSDDEQANLTSWPPAATELAAFRFEITTARIDAGSPFKDVIRMPARIVGLYDTGLDALDSFTLVTDVSHARMLLGFDPEQPVVNVVVLRGGDLVAAREAAEEAGWRSERPGDFARRYIGQLIDVVELLSVLVASLFFALPVFLLWHGLAQMLDRNEREVAVCRAIGVPRSVVRGAVGRLTARVCGAGLLGGLAVLLVAAVALSGLEDWAGSPLPMGFRVPTWGYAVTFLLVAGSAVASAWITIRAHERLDIVARLRSS